MATQFEINGSAPTPASAKPPGQGGEGCMIHFPDSRKRTRADGHSVTIGKPYVRLHWPVMPAAGAAYYYGLGSFGTVPSVALTSGSFYNSTSANYTTYSTSIIMHRPTYGDIYASDQNIWYIDFEVWFTELS